MAIERVEKARTEFTPVTLALLGVAAALTLVSMAVIYLAFGNWRFKTELTDGYEAYDRGIPGRAATALKDALSWRPTHRGARELLAKIAVESGNLDEAQAHYEKLQKLGHDSARVRVGLGVIALRKADGAEDLKQAQDLVKQAQDYFRGVAGTLPEAELGLGHCELLLAARLKDPARIETARKTFEKVRAALDADGALRAKITRDGLVDYYAGLGRALSQGVAYDPAAAAAWRACQQYARRWLVPQAALLSLEARRLMEWREGLDGLNRIRVDANRLRNEAADQIRRSGDTARPLVEPWMVYSLSLAQAWARSGSLAEHQNIVSDITRPGFGIEGRLEPFIVDANVKLELAAKDQNRALQEQAVTRALVSLTDIERRATSPDDLTKERRARALNQAAALEAWRAGASGNKLLWQSAYRKLQEALKLFPDEYVYNRNAAVILKRLASAPPAIQPHREKAKAAASGAYAEDFQQLDAFLGPAN